MNPYQILGASLVTQLIKESASNAGDLGSIPGLGRPLEKGKATPSVHGFTKSWTWLSDFHFTRYLPISDFSFSLIQDKTIQFNFGPPSESIHDLAEQHQ